MLNVVTKLSICACIALTISCNREYADIKFSLPDSGLVGENLKITGSEGVNYRLFINNKEVEVCRYKYLDDLNKIDWDSFKVPDLPPGDYLFEIKSYKDRKLRDRPVLSITFTIKAYNESDPWLPYKNGDLYNCRRWIEIWPVDNNSICVVTNSTLDSYGYLYNKSTEILHETCFDEGKPLANFKLEVSERYENNYGWVECIKKTSTEMSFKDDLGKIYTFIRGVGCPDGNCFTRPF